MCGIWGRVGDKRAVISINDKLESMRNRGPDSTSTLEADWFDAGMVRLAINGLTDGDQPFYDVSERYLVFYNGEIYNYPYLLELLASNGTELTTGVDGEVIPHLYAMYGAECFQMLDGMFSISIFDTELKSLILVRDALGEKPLFYRNDNNVFEYSSDLKAFAVEGLKVSKQAVWDAATLLWVPEPNTIYENVKKVKKGHMLTISYDLKISEDKWYKPKRKPKTGESYETIVQNIKKLVVDSVERRLMSDVPIGCFLSGGLDSSIIAKIISDRLDAFNTYSVAFGDLKDDYHGRVNEADDARVFAELLGTEHHEIYMNAEKFNQLLPRFVENSDGIFGVSSGIGVLAVAEEAAKHGVKVLLSGDCADEIFGGYSWYTALDQLSEPKHQKSNSGLSFQHQLHSKKRIIDDIAGQSDLDAAVSLHYYADEFLKHKIFSKIFTTKLLDTNRIFNGVSKNNPITFINNDRDLYLTNEMLTKLDRMTMAASVEGRVPFASVSIFEYSSSLELKDLIEGKTLKKSLRDAFISDLPRDIIERPKHGFNFPLDTWLKSDLNHLVSDAFSKGSWLYQNEWIDNTALRTVNEMLTRNERLVGHFIFTLITFNMWMEKRHAYT